MKLIDRYVLRLFLKSLTVCFISFTGLYIVIDTFGNLDEFLEYNEQIGARVFFDYYGPRVLTFFDRTSSLLALIAAIFALTWMQRTNELTAIQAAGVSKGRIVKPLLIATMVIAMLAVINRELLIPQVRDQLTRNAQNWLGEQDRKMTPIFDVQTGVLFTGKSTRASDQMIDLPSLQLPQRLGQFGETLSAAQAYYEAADGTHPSGYRLHEVSIPDDLDDIESVRSKDGLEILSPKDTPWLESGQCFVTSAITFDELANGRDFRQYSSTWELIRSLRNPSLDFGTSTRVLVHARVVQPFLDLSLVLLGLPLVSSRSTRNIFVAAGSCFLVVAVVLVTTLVIHSLGGFLVIRPAALAAWLPVMLFVPVAYVMFKRGWD